MKRSFQLLVSCPCPYVFVSLIVVCQRLIGLVSYSGGSVCFHYLSLVLVLMSLCPGLSFAKNLTGWFTTLAAAFVFVLVSCPCAYVFVSMIVCCQRYICLVYYSGGRRCFRTYLLSLSV